MFGKILFSVLTAMVFFSGCATKNSLAPGTGGSTFEIRGKNFNDIWKATVKVVSTSLTITETNKEAGIVKAEKGPGLATWGEVVGVYISPTIKDAKVYTVEVQSLKRSTLQITGQDWTMTMIAGIKAELDQ
jgi:hypothetical protein